MKLDIKATQITLTPAIRAFVEEKVGSLDKKVARYGTSVSADIEVGMTTKHHKKGPIFRAEVRVFLPGKEVYAESEDLNLYTAIIGAKKEAEAQITKYKGAKEDKGKRANDSRKRA